MRKAGERVKKYSAERDLWENGYRLAGGVPNWVGRGQPATHLMDEGFGNGKDMLTGESGPAIAGEGLGPGGEISESRSKSKFGKGHAVGQHA